MASQRVGAERRPMSEAIQSPGQDWIASSQVLLAMTVDIVDLFTLFQRSP